MNNYFLLGAMSLEAIYALSAAIAIAVVAAAGAIGMAFVIRKAIESIARQPEADAKIRASLLLGLVFIETAIVFTLVIAILIVINIL